MGVAGAKSRYTLAKPQMGNHGRNDEAMGAEPDGSLGNIGAMQREHAL